MRSLTTIQVTKTEDREIAQLRSRLGLKSKKEVLREGLRALQGMLRGQQRRKRLHSASLAVRGSSIREGRRWAALATPLKVR